MITRTALKEKIRKKVFITTLIISVFTSFCFSAGGATVTLNGAPITDPSVLLPVLISVLHLISCAMAIVISLGTIPTEYERNTHHLVLVRNVSVSRYHVGLSMANLIASLIAHVILFAGTFAFVIAKGQTNLLPNLFATCLYSGLSVSLVSLMASVLSIRLPKMAAGMICTVVTLAGAAYFFLDLLRSMMTGIVGTILNVVLQIIPNLYQIEKGAESFVNGGQFEWHAMWKALLYCYIFMMGILLIRRKEQ